MSEAEQLAAIQLTNSTSNSILLNSSNTQHHSGSASAVCHAPATTLLKLS
jgi:hypothetical protein